MNSRNHMKIQKCVIFGNTNLKISMLKIKNIVILETIVTIQGNIEAHRICN